MSVMKLANHLFLIDVETAGIRGFIASYILKGKKTALIETGPTSSIPNLLSGLDKLGIRREDVAYVAVSHIHLDHGGGVGTLLKSLPAAEVVVHQRGAAHLAHPEKLWQQSKEVLGEITELYYAPEPVPEYRIVAAVDGMAFDLGNGVELKVVETTGHASHHQSYYERLGEGVFPGDAAGIYVPSVDVVVPTTPAPFRLDIALSSLDKLADLKPKHLYYSHFGEATNPLERLKAYRRQLMLWAEIARQGIENKENLETISQRIVEEDFAVKKALTHVRTHSILNRTVLNQSVYGVVSFVEEYGGISE